MYDFAIGISRRRAVATAGESAVTTRYAMSNGFSVHFADMLVWMGMSVVPVRETA